MPSGFHNLLLFYLSFECPSLLSLPPLACPSLVEGSGLFYLFCLLICRQSARQPRQRQLCASHVCLSCFLVSHSVFYTYFFLPFVFLLPSASVTSACSHLCLLVPPDFSSLAAAATVSLLKTVLLPDRGSCGSQQSNRDPHRPAAIWPQIRICFLNNCLGFYFFIFIFF